MLLVVDANELFSALIGKGRRLRLFFDSRLELISPEFILSEFEEHLDEISRKSGLAEDETLAFLILLLPSIKLIKFDEYKEFLPRAKEIAPDVDDVEYFALALKFNCPIWSEDLKLKKQSVVRVLTTAELLRELKKF